MDGGGNGQGEPAGVRLRRLVQAAVVVCVVAAAGYWMLADTIAKYAPSVAVRPLRVSFWGPFQEFRMWKEMLANFRREHPDIPVRMEYFPSRYDQKIGQLLVADDAPDVILYQDEPFPNIIERDEARGIEPKFVNLTHLAGELGETLDRRGLLETFWQTSVEYFGRWEPDGAGGRTWCQYGMPIWGGCNLLYYNKACLSRCGVEVVTGRGEVGLARSPEADRWLLDDEKWTLDEFVRLCRILTVDADGDGRSEQFGLSLGSPVYWLPIHYACGADILNAERTRTVFMGPAVEKSLRLWQDLMYADHAMPRAAELGQMGEGVGFFTGRVAMFCSGPWGMPFLNECGLAYDVLHVPRDPATGRRATRITWDAVCIAANSGQKRNAYALIKHLTSMGSMKVIANVQRSIPARREAKDYFIAVNPKVSVAKFVAAAGSYARMQPITKHWSIMQRAWSDAMGELRRDNAAKRLTVPEAIGYFYTHRKLNEVLPPADAELAERYRRVYRRRQGGSAGP